jgi:hypothetical protein
VKTPGRVHISRDADAMATMGCSCARLFSSFHTDSDARGSESLHNRSLWSRLVLLKARGSVRAVMRHRFENARPIDPIKRIAFTFGLASRILNP